MSPEDVFQMTANFRRGNPWFDEAARTIEECAAAIGEHDRARAALYGRPTETTDATNRRADRGADRPA